VKTLKENITVLGTSFNVNAYAEENNIKTSLLEGSIKIGGKLLKPGDAYRSGKIIRTNLDQDIAWKRGIFDFSQMKLPDAMRQLARWYDVEVEIKGNVKDIEFGGTIGRNLTLQQVLNGLEGIDDVHFQLNGKTLTVTPWRTVKPYL
jgi:transmembrane sensor